MRRALGIRRSWRQKVAPFTLLGIVTIPAIVNVGIGYVTRDRFLTERIEIITYREYVGVSAALLLFVALVAPDVMCPDRRQHVLPLMFARPITGVDYVAGQARRDRDDPLRVLVPAPGRAVRRQHARQRQRARLLHRPSRRAVEGAARGRAAGRVLRRRSVSRSRRSPTAASSRARRSSASSSSRRSRRPSSSVTSRWRAAPPARSSTCSAMPLYLRDLVFLGHVGRRVAALGRDQRRAARDRHVRRGRW